MKNTCNVQRLVLIFFFFPHHQPDIRASEDPVKGHSFTESPSKTDGEIHTPTSPGLRRRFV